MTKRLSINSVVFTQLYCFVSMALYSWFFFREGMDDNLAVWYMPIIFVMMWQILFVVFNLLPPRVFKPLSVGLLILNAVAFYFTSAYNVQIDKIMFMNAMQTDKAEVGALMNLQFGFTVVLMGVIPALAFCALNIIKVDFPHRLKASLAALMVCVLSGSICHPQTDKFLHRFKYLMEYLPPINYIAGGSSAVFEVLKPHPPMRRISEDIRPLSKHGKPNLIVFIVGETTRAANFSLNGYHRPTNEALTPYLNEIAYYPDTQACGTSTAVSVPCMFLPTPREEYKTGSELHIENLLDVYKQAGYKVLWRDNDGGCKHICDRVLYEEPCDEKVCLDDILLRGLKGKISASRDNQLVVLHTRGSHGPTYNQQYDESSNHYAPACQDNYLWNCTPEELTNAYDNTVHYVSGFIARTIELLQSLQGRYNTALFYVSDHGESLGENDQYLHAAPYNKAPDYQINVPMLLWLPQNNGFNLSTLCLKQQAQAGYSHDNVFHSLLGLSGISGAIYNPELDIFSTCRKK